LITIYVDKTICLQKNTDLCTQAFLITIFENKALCLQKNNKI